MVYLHTIANETDNTLDRFLNNDSYSLMMNLVINSTTRVDNLSSISFFGFSFGSCALFSSWYRYVPAGINIPVIKQLHNNNTVAER